MVRNNKKKFSVKVKQQIVASTFSCITMILWDIIHSCVLSKHTDGLTAGNWKMTLFMICKICLLVQECLQSCRISVLLIDFCPAQYNYENESLSKSFQFVHTWIIIRWKFRQMQLPSPYFFWFMFVLIYLDDGYL